MHYDHDKEYMTYVGHLIQHPKVQKLSTIPTIFIPTAWSIPFMSATPATRWPKDLVGMPKAQLGVVSYMIYFITIGVRPSLQRVTPGFIHALL